MGSSIGMMRFPTEWENKIHVPNHQPEDYLVWESIYVNMNRKIRAATRNRLEIFFLISWGVHEIFYWYFEGIYWGFPNELASKTFIAAWLNIIQPIWVLGLILKSGHI